MHKNPLFLPSFGQKFIVIFADFLLKIFNKAKTAKKKYQQSANQQSDNRAHRHVPTPTTTYQPDRLLIGP